MNVSTEMEGSSYALEKAILVYERKRGFGYGPHSGHDAIASVHDVHQGTGGQAVVGAGRPVTEAGLHGLRDAMGGKREAAFLPEHILALGPDKLIWHAPPARRVHFFSSRASEVLEALDGALLPTPDLVFMAERRGFSSARLSVWAVRQRGRPGPDTILYHAPYFNVNASGGVCHGSMKAPDSCRPDTTEAWEKAFFSSSFTHGAGARFLEGKPDYGETLAGLQGEDARFPTARLCRTGDRLKDQI